MNIEKYQPLHQFEFSSFLKKGIRLFLVITIFCVFIPPNPTAPMEGLDNSWIFGMNQAIAQHLAFGRDIIFTFGPYASYLHERILSRHRPADAAGRNMPSAFIYIELGIQDK